MKAAWKSQKATYLGNLMGQKALAILEGQGLMECASRAVPEVPSCPPVLRKC